MIITQYVTSSTNYDTEHRERMQSLSREHVANAAIAERVVRRNTVEDTVLDKYSRGVKKAIEEFRSRNNK